METIKILIVDNDSDWASMMGGILKKEPGFQVIQAAHNPEEALEAVKAKELDVALVDLSLSGNRYDGLHTVLDILNVKPLKIIITSFQDDERIISVLKTNGIRFVNNRDYSRLASTIVEVAHSHGPVAGMREKFNKVFQLLNWNL